MTFRETLYCAFISFFVIFTLSKLVIYCMDWFLSFGDPLWHYKLIIPLLVISVLTSLAWFIIYSKKPLTSKQLLLRYVLAFVAVIFVTFSALEYIRILYEWGLGLGIYVSVLFATLIIFACIVGIPALQSKSIADQCNRDLSRQRRELNNCDDN